MAPWDPSPKRSPLPLPSSSPRAWLGPYISSALCLLPEAPALPQSLPSFMGNRSMWCGKQRTRARQGLCEVLLPAWGWGSQPCAPKSGCTHGNPPPDPCHPLVPGAQARAASVLVSGTYYETLRKDPELQVPSDTSLLSLSSQSWPEWKLTPPSDSQSWLWASLCAPLGACGLTAGARDTAPADFCVS